MIETCPRAGGGSEGHDLRRLRDIAREEGFAAELDNVTEKVRHTGGGL